MFLDGGPPLLVIWGASRVKIIIMVPISHLVVNSSSSSSSLLQLEAVVVRTCPGQCISHLLLRNPRHNTILSIINLLKNHGGEMKTMIVMMTNSPKLGLSPRRLQRLLLIHCISSSNIVVVLVKHP